MVRVVKVHEEPSRLLTCDRNDRMTMPVFGSHCSTALVWVGVLMSGTLLVDQNIRNENVTKKF